MAEPCGPMRLTGSGCLGGSVQGEGLVMELPPAVELAAFGTKWQARVRQSTCTERQNDPSAGRGIACVPDRRL
jgi:hypothetical protein